MINLSIENLAGTMKQVVFRKYKLEDLVFQPLKRKHQITDKMDPIKGTTPTIVLS